MALFLSQVDKEIWNTLDARQLQVDSNRAGWLSKKTPWVRFTSMASVGDDSELRKKWILYGGTTGNAAKSQYASGYSEMYNMSDDMYIKPDQSYHSAATSIKNRPMPGLTNISIENKGSMGALREAVINFVCWDLRQLNVLEKLYMTPGISCLLEWGWSIDMNGDPINSNLSNKPPMTDELMAQKISDEVIKTGGNYDALQGPVVDFSWTLRDDGGFDCTTTLTSRATSLLAINIHGQSGEMGSEQVDGDPPPYEEDMKAMINNIAFTLEWVNELKNAKGEVVGQLIPVEGKFTAHKEDDELSAVTSGKGLRIFGGGSQGNLVNPMYNTQSGGKGEINNSNQGYVTWAYIEELLNDNLSFVSRATNAAGDPVPRLNSNKTFNGEEYGWINYRTNLISSDPYVCILPNARMNFPAKYTKRIKPGTKRQKKKGNVGKINKPVQYQTSTTITNYSMYQISPALKNSFFKADNPNRIQLSKILVNIRFVYSTFKVSETFSEFIMNLLNGISEACGGMWDFQLMNDEQDPEVLYIVDVKTINVPDPTPYQFKVYNRNSIVKNVTFNTEVDQKIKAMMMYGATRDENASESGVESTYGYKLYRDSVVDLSYGPMEPKNQNSTQFNQPVSQTQIDPLSNLYISIKKMHKKRTEATVSRLKTAVQKLVVDLNVDEDNKVASNQEYVMLPVKLGLTIDGLGGIRFGNAVDIDYKPDRYSDNTYFQITNVSHTIGTDTWDTTIDTIMRVDMSGYEGLKSKPYAGAGSLDYGKLQPSTTPGAYNSGTGTVNSFQPPTNTFVKGRGPIL